MAFVIRLVLNAVALWVTAQLISGIEVDGGSKAENAWTLLAVALIFGVVNAVLKPVIKVLGFPLYLLTLGLFALVVNGLLFWLCSWVADKVDLPFHITGFWPAFWGAIVMGIVSWLLNFTAKAATS